MNLLSCSEDRSALRRTDKKLRTFPFQNEAFTSIVTIIMVTMITFLLTQNESSMVDETQCFDNFDTMTLNSYLINVYVIS